MARTLDSQIQQDTNTQTVLCDDLVSVAICSVYN